MKFYRRVPGTPSRIAVFAGSFNPPTVAHLAVAEAALTQVDEVLFVLPEVFPHKDFSGVGFDGRLQLLLTATNRPGFSVASTEGGLFRDIARELRPHCPEASLHFLCGRDAAERIVNWEYDTPDALPRMFAEFSLLVAARDGHYAPPAAHAGAIAKLEMERDYREISATEVRRLLLTQGDWESLIPAAIRSQVADLYRAS